MNRDRNRQRWCWLLVAVAILLSSAASSHARALLDDARIECMHQYYRLLDEQLRDEMIASYRLGQCAGREWDEQAHDLITHAVLTFHGRTNRLEPIELDRMARALYTEGCRSAMLEFIRGIAMDDMGIPTAARVHYRNAASQIDRGERFTPLVHALLASRLGYRLGRVSAQRHEADPYFQIAAKKLVEHASAVPNDDVSQRLLLGILRKTLRHEMSGEYGDVVIDELSNDPSTNPAMLLTAKGMVEIKKAWDARGRGFAGTVTPRGWKAFADHMETAAHFLELAHEGRPDWPEAAELMMLVTGTGHAGGRAESPIWFERAVAGQSDWSQAYHTRLFHMSPRWGGSNRKMMAFALECADTKRYDTLIPFRLLDGISFMIDDSGGNHDGIAEYYPQLRETLEGFLAHPHHESRRSYFQVVLFIAKWAAGHYGEALAMLDDLPNDPGARDAWRDMLANRRLVTREVVMYASDWAPTFRDIEAAVAEGRYNEAINRYEELLPQVEDDRLHRAAKDRLATAQMAAQFASGQWIDVAFDKHLSGWHLYRHGWAAPEDGGNALRMRHLFARPMLIANAPFGQRWELTVRIDMSDLRQHSRVDGGIKFGFSNRRNMEYAQFLTIRPFANEVIVGYRRKSVTFETIKINEDHDFVFDVHVKQWDHYIEAHVNGEQVFAGMPRGDERYDDGDRIGLGGTYQLPRGEVRYSNLRIRALSDPPAALTPARKRRAVDDDDDGFDFFRP